MTKYKYFDVGYLNRDAHKLKNNYFFKQINNDVYSKIMKSITSDLNIIVYKQKHISFNYANKYEKYYENGISLKNIIDSINEVIYNDCYTEHGEFISIIDTYVSKDTNSISMNISLEIT